MSKLFSLEKRDWIHGAFMAAGGAFTTALLELFTTGHLPQTKEDWQRIALCTLVAGLTYLQKKFFSDEEGKLGGKI